MERKNKSPRSHLQGRSKVDEMRRRDMIHLHRLACLAFSERNWEIKLLYLYIYGSWERCILAYCFASWAVHCVFGRKWGLRNEMRDISTYFFLQICFYFGIRGACFFWASALVTSDERRWIRSKNLSKWGVKTGSSSEFFGIAGSSVGWIGDPRDLWSEALAVSAQRPNDKDGCILMTRCWILLGDEVVPLSKTCFITQ